MGPPQQKHGPAKSPLRKQLRRAYHISGFLADIFEKPFGFFQQWHWRIADQLDNERDHDNSQDGRA
jgi:hypothetical protein